MFIPSTLEDVRSQYPRAFEAAVSDFRRSRSKRKGEPLVSFAWGFEVYAQVPTLKFADVLSGVAQDQRAAFEALSVDEKTRDYANRCGVSIVGKLGGRVYLQSMQLDKVPAVVLEHHRRWLVKEEVETKRVAGLSETERRREFDAAIRHLEHGKGLQVFSSTRKG